MENVVFIIYEYHLIAAILLMLGVLIGILINLNNNNK